jgi:AraC-like DNA-binding protein
MLHQKTIGRLSPEFFHLGALDGCDEPAEGSIWRICFADKFFIENLDYRFRRPASKRYHEHRRFMEILCLDSIDAVHKEERSPELPVKAGFSAHLNRGRAGEICFFANTAVRGVRIVVAEEFHNRCLKRWFREGPSKAGNSGSESELRLAAGQIRRSLERENSSGFYYESKVAELLYWIAAAARNAENGKSTGKTSRALTREDWEAVGKVKAVIDERVSDAPKIGELSALSGTSASKLQNDFKTAYGVTIHGYVQKVRMTEALHRVENSSEPLCAIARALGCKNPSRFSEIFRKAYGLTPTEYRSLTHSAKK